MSRVHGAHADCLDSPRALCRSNRVRTGGLPLRRRTLYPLSYGTLVALPLGRTMRPSDWRDSNPRPPGPQPGALPTAPPENEKVPRPLGRGWLKSARTHRAEYGDRQALQLPRVPHKGPTRGSVAFVRRVQVRVELVSGSAQGGVVASSADTLVRRIVTTLHRVQERAGEQVALDGIVGADGAGIATCGDGLLPRLRPQGGLPAL